MPEDIEVETDKLREQVDEAREGGPSWLRFVGLGAAIFAVVAAVSALRSGDAATAARDFGVLLERDPSYAVAHYDLALAEIDLRRYDDAERELRTALTLAPRYPRAEFALGTVLLRTGKRTEARATFDAVTRSSSDPTLTNLAASMRDAIVR